jgi:hypothetical protein
MAQLPHLNRTEVAVAILDCGVLIACLLTYWLVTNLLARLPDAWQQPILRLADTVVGVVVGVAAAWVGLRVLRPRIQQARQPGQEPARPQARGLQLTQNETEP